MTHLNQTAETTLGAWTTSGSLPADVAYSQAIVTKNRVYLLGGYINDTPSSTVYTAPINPDGTLGEWTTANSLPGIVAYSQAIVTKNRVYLLGGHTGISSSSIVYTAPINSDGTLGEWTTSTPLPATVYASQAIVTKSRVYLLGEYSNGSYSSTVYTASINPDGTLGAWTTSTSLPADVAFSQAIVTKTQVYLLGGLINGSYSSTVYTASINPDGTLGAWTTSNSLPGTVAYSQAIVTKNRAYLLGGAINSAPSSTVYTAPINPDGTLGAWTTSVSLPATVAHSQAIVTKSRVYLLGGYSNGEDSSTVYTATIEENTVSSPPPKETTMPSSAKQSAPVPPENKKVERPISTKTVMKTSRLLHFISEEKGLMNYDPVGHRFKFIPLLLAEKFSAKVTYACEGEAIEVWSNEAVVKIIAEESLRTPCASVEDAIKNTYRRSYGKVVGIFNSEFSFIHTYHSKDSFRREIFENCTSSLNLCTGDYSKIPPRSELGLFLSYCAMLQASHLHEILTLKLSHIGYLFKSYSVDNAGVVLDSEHLFCIAGKKFKLLVVNVKRNEINVCAVKA